VEKAIKEIRGKKPPEHADIPEDIQSLGEDGPRIVTPNDERLWRAA